MFVFLVKYPTNHLLYNIKLPTLEKESTDSRNLCPDFHCVFSADRQGCSFCCWTQHPHADGGIFHLELWRQQFDSIIFCTAGNAFCRYALFVLWYALLPCSDGSKDVDHWTGNLHFGSKQHLPCICVAQHHTSLYSAIFHSQYVEPHGSNPWLYQCRWAGSDPSIG